MKLNLETKFNVGDTVYATDSYEVYWANPVPYSVTDIFIKVAKTKDVVITYRLIQDELTDVVAEKFLFNTYEECTKWCEEQNESL